jgi:hypothetical protein
MRQQVKAIVITNPLLELLCCELTIRLNDGTLAMHPVRLNRIEPGTFGWQLADEDTDLASVLGLAIVLADPATDFGAEVPRSIVPDQQPRLLAFRLQAFTAPSQKLSRDGRDGTAFNKAQPHLVEVGTQQAITSQRLGIRVALIGHELNQAQWLVGAPGVQARLGKTRPPNFIHVAQNPLRMRLRQADQPIAALFLTGTPDQD